MQHTITIASRPAHAVRETDHLRQEIAFLQARLQQIGDQGDCAYERALGTVYRTLLDQRCQQLNPVSAARS